MKRLAWLLALPLTFGCAKAERRPDLVADAPAGPAVAEPTTPTTMAPTGEPVTDTGIYAAPPAPSDDKKRLIEEYKALALKNDCSKGYRGLDGEWKFVGQSKTPNYTDTLVIKGTRFTETMSGNPDGKYLAAEMEGEIRCVFKNRVLVQIDKVSPEGAYGNRSGDVYPCDLLSDMDDKVERMLMICYFDWDLRTAAGLEFEYEKQVPKP
ncbi:MAG: hypothetical protein IT385_07975 [Deltaproteobacteria bacterium]|nr:hypothetical protein [Deltaproteobacteria bacterium]